MVEVETLTPITVKYMKCSLYFTFYKPSRQTGLCVLCSERDVILMCVGKKLCIVIVC